MPRWPVHRSITRAKRVVIRRISSSSLPQPTAHFSDGTGLGSRAGPPPEQGRANTVLLKTRKQLIGIPTLACGLGYSTLRRKILHVHLVPLNVGSRDNARHDLRYEPDVDFSFSALRDTLHE
jgi:hypothetical protein